MKLFERTMSAVGRVDREAGIIYGVKLLGRKSKNNREYTTDAMRGAIGLYEGVKAHVNHDRENYTDRDWHEWVGRVEHVQLRADGLYGDLRLRRSSPLFAEIIEAAEDFPQDFGMSHVADGDSRMVDGREIVESIKEVFSVDIVLVPATTSGLFESAEWSKTVDAAFGIAARALDACERGLKAGDGEDAQTCLAELNALNEQMAALVPAEDDMTEAGDDDHEPHSWNGGLGESINRHWRGLRGN